ncbi:MAG: hypothetical protein WEA61_03170 [Anaerolineales bacterium]
MVNGKTKLLTSTRTILFAGGALLGILGTLTVLFVAGWLTIPQSGPPAMIHNMGAGIMPFDLSLTTHIFEMTETGGIQQVIANDPGDSEQIALIQQHLQHEAMLFISGDFSDPASLHGDDMPGVRELSSAAGQVEVEYAALPDGAQITFSAQDIYLITAIHRWFGAQLSDHGSDATYR